MSAQESQWEWRLARLVGRQMYETDPQYHAQIALFRRWMEATRMAMEDEGVAPDVIERALNRIVLGAPDGVDAYERVALHQQGIATALGTVRGHRD